MYDDFIYLDCNRYSGTDKKDGHEYTIFRIAFAVIPPDTYYEGYECADTLHSILNQFILENIPEVD